VDAPNFLSCAGDQNQQTEVDAFENQNTIDESKYCEKCLKSKDIWTNQEATEKNIKSLNYQKSNLISKNSNPYKNQKIIINADFNFPKKNEHEMSKDGPPHNESFSLSVIYQNFDNENSSKYFPVFRGMPRERNNFN
jgi:hypothetical protein